MESPDDDLESSLKMLEPVIEIELRFHCPNSKCDGSFKRESQLKQHLEQCGKKNIIAEDNFDNEKIHKCPNENCGKTYKYKDSLTRHVNGCGQSFACSNPGCSKAFNAENNLAQHLRVCGADTCPCGYVFGEMNYLVGHQTRCKVSSYFKLSFFPIFFFSNSFYSLLALH